MVLEESANSLDGLSFTVFESIKNSKSRGLMPNKS